MCGEHRGHGGYRGLISNLHSSTVNVVGSSTNQGRAQRGAEDREYRGHGKHGGLISNLHFTTVIGCGGELNQSGKGTERHGGHRGCRELISNLHCHTVIGCGGNSTNQRKVWRVQRVN